MKTYHAVKFLSKREKLPRDNFIRTESGLQKWRCEKCLELFKNRNNLYDHKSERHGY